MVSSIFDPKKSKGSSSQPTGGSTSGSSQPASSSNNGQINIYLTIYIFRGAPDSWYNRHVLLYCTSPDDANFHETIHVQRHNSKSPWAVDRIHKKVEWELTKSYINHVNAGVVKMRRGQEMLPLEIIASSGLKKNSEPSEWNCQHFLLEGLQKLVKKGLQTQAWYDHVEGELMDRIIDGAKG